MKLAGGAFEAVVKGYAFGLSKTVFKAKVRAERQFVVLFSECMSLLFLHLILQLVALHVPAFYSHNYMYRSNINNCINFDIKEQYYNTQILS